MTEFEIFNHIKLHYSKENESCEWKAFTNLKHNVAAHQGEDIVSYVSAISNMKGGHLVVGVEDKSLQIIGIKEFHDLTPENLPQRLVQTCTNLSTEGLQVEPFTSEDSQKTVWVIHIPKHLPRKPVYAHKTAWQRNGDSLIKLTPEREGVILNEAIVSIDDWSAEICELATIDDLDPRAIQFARENYKSKYQSLANEVDEWNDTTFLNKAKIIIKGKITRAAILLLGKPESEHFISPATSKIRWILKDKGGVEMDYAIFSCPLLFSVDAVYEKIRNLKYRYLKKDSLFPEEVDMYEPYVLREAINNCIAHQDYTKGGQINVVERDSEVLFTNLGSFIPGNVDAVIMNNSPEEYYRNRFLAHAMHNLKMVDTIGSGIRRMFDFQRKKFFPLPEYDIHANRVSVTIIGKVLDLEYANILVKNPDLNLEDILVLDKLQKHKKLTKDEFYALKNKGLLEGTFRTPYISRKLAETTGQKTTYTKHKAFHKDAYFGWIIKGIEEHGSLSRQEINDLLFEHLPVNFTDRQKKNKVANLLSEMRRDGYIKNAGTDSKPQWVIDKKNDFQIDWANLDINSLFDPQRSIL